ncbi:hypothetical protein KSP40_PGU015334 [Platanthera guangdongensis]|uniref:Nucleotide-diphospho-sugar transferase domain-containing protein n=1 Tax=Platanthera guangdongensis TaxID=2320717 RepID=A0ABR2MNU9_9ASPA
MLAKQRATLGASAGGKLRKRSHFISSFIGVRIIRLLDLKVSALRRESLIFLFGSLAFTVGLYSGLKSGGNEDVFPSLTIFAAPRPFSFSGGRPDSAGRCQELAVRSWLALAPEVSVVLFGKDSSLFDLARILGPRVTVDSDIDFTFVGTPFFHCLLAKSQKSSSTISVVIDPETILLPNILTALHCAYKLDRDWFLVSSMPSISKFPFRIVDTGKHWLKEDGASIGIAKIQEYVIKEMKWNHCSKKLLMAWNTGEVPLYAGIIPPFLQGRGFHDSWVLNEVLSSEFRLVIDASYLASAIYPEYLSNHFKRTISSDTSPRNWEVRRNHHLAASYGSIYSGQQSIPTTHLKLIECFGKLVFIDGLRMINLRLNKSNGHHFGLKHGMPFFLGRFLHLQKQELIHCIEDINILGTQCSLEHALEIAYTKPLTLSNPFDLESFLHIIADKDKTVVLAIAGENYRDMLMSWVCRLRYLAVSNFIVCALDTETYQFALLMGLPVFMDPHAPSNISFNDCHFGTDCFQRVTKVKSRLVLQILKLGYNVLLSDVDVYWFINPLVYLHSFGPAILVSQSDEYNETGPINLPRRLNSGFYFSRSDPATIAAMEMVVEHASVSPLSEQPSFYDVLCGEGGVNRVDDNHCVEPHTNLTIHFLDRNLFPNGAYKGLWGKLNVASSCKELGCIILHNNWISGRKRKLERQVNSGLWEYDPALRMCLHSWHRTSLTSHFL